MKTKIAGYDPETKTKTFTPELFKLGTSRNEIAYLETVGSDEQRLEFLNRIDAQENKDQEQRETLDGVFRLLGRFGLVLIALAAIYGAVKYFDVSIDLVEVVKWF